METVTIPKAEYERLKAERIEEFKKGSLLD